MRIFPFLLLLILAGSAAATATSFTMAAGETRDFLITGSSPTITVDRGMVDVTDMVSLGAGLWLVTLHCRSSSTDGCEGEIHS